ncbi:hypothetical protein ACHAWF_014288 [Thalassiosira exigua]
MTSKLHTSLALTCCYTACIVIFTSSFPLIGLLHGPSGESNATDQQQQIRAKLLALGKDDDHPGWPWEGGFETAESVFGIYRDVAYRDPRALLLHDAGMIAAIFTLLLALAPKFFSHTSYSARQRLCFFILMVPLSTTGLAGQVAIQQTIPFELLLVERWGLLRGLSFIAYCSMKSLSLGLGGEEASSLLTASFYELKVLGSAGFLVFLILGL